MIRYRNFADLVDRMDASSPQQTALLVCDGGEKPQPISWSELAALVRERADELVESGHACEAILADGTPACVVEVFAAVRAGLQVALVDPLMPNRVTGVG